MILTIQECSCYINMSNPVSKCKILLKNNISSPISPWCKCLWNGAVLTLSHRRAVLRVLVANSGKDAVHSTQSVLWLFFFCIILWCGWLSQLPACREWVSKGEMLRGCGRDHCCFLCAGWESGAVPCKHMSKFLISPVPHRILKSLLLFCSFSFLLEEYNQTAIFTWALG